MMRYFGVFKVVLLLGLVGVVCSSCRRTPSPEQGYDIVLDPNIEFGDEAQQAQTKVTGTAFDKDDVISLYATIQGSPLANTGNYIQNASYTRGVRYFEPTTGADKKSYPTAGTPITLYAIYPYSATAIDSPTAYTFTVKADQSVLGAQAASDCMTSLSTKDMSPTMQPVRMLFKHTLAKVNVNAKATNFVDGETIASIQMRMYSKAKVNIEGQTAPASTEDKITITPLVEATVGGADNWSKSVSAIVAPQVLVQAMGCIDIVMSNGAIYTYNPTAAQTLVSGNEYTFNLVVDYGSREPILLGTIGVGTWGTGSAGGGQAEQVSQNKFTATLTNSGDIKTVTKVRLSVDLGAGEGMRTYELPVTNADGKLLFEFSGTGNKPNKYPFTIKGVEFLNAAGATFGKRVSVSQQITAVGQKWDMALDMLAEAANTYVIIPGGEVTFDATIAGNGSIFKGSVNASDAEVATLQANLKNNINSVKILWQTRQGHTNVADPMVLESVSYANGFATVKARSGGTGGNAVVAAYAADGTTILWSWHIWVSPVAESTFAKHNYGPAFEAANGSGRTIMDRNLGALSASETASMQLTGGMLYQWGRKDPFTGSADGTSDVYIQAYDKDGAALEGTLGGFTFEETGASLTKAVQVPTTHYWMTGHDWCSADEKKRWTSYSLTTATLDIDNKGDKTVFDPCPAGYRVPTGSSVDSQGTWGDFGFTPDNNPYWQNDGTVTAGSLFNQAGGTPSWYPASGHRFFNDGTLYGVATSGYSWSASSCNDSFNARSLEFGSPYVNLASDSRRSWGFPVRCVQE